MRKSITDTAVNRNNNRVYNHFNGQPVDTNSGEPYIHSAWMNGKGRKDVKSPEIEVIERRSPNSTSEDSTPSSYSQEWSYIDKLKLDLDNMRGDNNYDKAQYRHSLDGDSQNVAPTNSAVNMVSYTNDSSQDNSFAAFYSTENGYSLKPKYNHQINCFAIINRHYNMDSSDSTTDYCADIDPVECGGDVPENLHCNKQNEYNSNKLMNFDQKNGMHKRTVVIYSYKNRRILSENDFGIINIPSKDSASSSPYSVDSFNDESVSSQIIVDTPRVATPIPTCYTAKLNLDLTSDLPNVTEINEAKYETSAESHSKGDYSSGISTTHRTVNSWFTCNDDEIKKTEQLCNRNRPSDLEEKNDSLKIAFNDKLSTLPEVTSMEEAISESKPSKRTSRKNAATQTNEIFKTLKVIDTQTTPRKPRIPLADFLNSAETPMYKTVTACVHVPANEIDFDDKADYARNAKPRIHVTPNADAKNKPKLVTDPIENLETNDWIFESKVDKKNDDMAKSAGHRLLERNKVLLKASPWTSYSPIAASRQSLHISLGETDFGDEKSCWSNLVNCVFCRYSY